MVASIQPAQINTANLNKVGFGNEHENLTPEQPPVSLETPKDEFVSEKKKSHAVRNGAIIGGVLGVGSAFISRAPLVPLIARTGVFAAIGAGIGAIVKHFHKKEKAE
ncbi:MAG: hypothetical protein WCG23_05125 [bacterium]